MKMYTNIFKTKEGSKGTEGKKDIIQKTNSKIVHGNSTLSVLLQCKQSNSSNQKYRQSDWIKKARSSYILSAVDKIYFQNVN